MIDIIDKENCCGCTACYSKCPKKCIEMKEDKEGFQYPDINKELCINCGLCEQVCPIYTPLQENIFPQIAYLVQIKDEKIRSESTAGGAFTAIASYVLNQDGVVFGAAYDSNFQVYHTYVEKTDDLYRFRNSKYVQSRIGDSLEDTRKFLETGRLVCFSGTPCQIEGLVKFLNKKFNNLVLVDVVCHGVPSPLIWNKYLQLFDVIPKNVSDIRFRDKYYGYKYSNMSMFKGNKNIYHAGAEADPMLRAFFSDICDRPACYKCHFKKRYRVSDFTIWDCFSVYDFDKKMDDDKGTTRVLIHTGLGREMFEKIRGNVVYYEVNPDKLVKGVKEMFESVAPNGKRTQFFIDANDLTGKELFEKYYPVNAIVRNKSTLRIFLVRTGAYALMKRCLNKLKGR